MPSYVGGRYVGSHTHTHTVNYAMKSSLHFTDEKMATLTMKVMQIVSYQRVEFEPKSF